MAKFAGLRDPITLDFENSTLAYCVDAFSISMGALMGTSPVTAFVESATGIAEGGRTGLTAVTVGFCFFISVFFAPIFASIPSWATGGALVIVGSLMIRNVREINWDYPGDAIPSFLTLIMIPLTYNIAYGVIAGLGSYVLLNGVAGLGRVLTGGRVSPVLYELGERWRVPPGGLIPAWMRRLASGLRDRRRGWWRVWEGNGDEDNVMRGIGVQSITTSTVAGGNGSIDYSSPYPNGQYGGRYGAGESLYGPRNADMGSMNGNGNGNGGAGMQGVVLGNSPSYPQVGIGGRIMTLPQLASGMPMVEDDSGSEKDPSVVGYPPRKFA